MCAASLAFAAPNTAIKALGQDLKSFSPASITAHQGAEKKETVVIVLPQARVLNQWAKQGYVFEKPKETCKQMGEAVGNKSNILLMGNTHMY